MKSLVYKTSFCLFVIIFCILFTSCREFNRLVTIDNQTNSDLYVVLSIEYPNTYLPSNFDGYNIYNIRQRVKAHDSKEIIDWDISIDDLFKKNSMLLVLVYQPKGDPIYIIEHRQQDIEHMQQEHCEAISYVYTREELKAQDWVITVTDSDILEYQATHETEPIESLSE